MLFVPADPVAVSARPRYLLVEDLDRDGIDDVVVVSTRDSVSILYGSPTSHTLFEAPVLVRFGRRLRRATTGDTNSDGLADIVVADERLKGAFVIESKGPRSYSTPRFVSFGIKAYSVAIANLDNQGGADILVGERRDGKVQIRHNQGNSRFTPGITMSTRSGLERIECADMNGDQLPELIGVSSGRVGRITLFPASDNRGAVEYGNSISFPTDANQANLVIEDLDASGTMDLALLSGTRGRTTSRVEITMTAADNTIAATRYIEISCPRNRSNRRCRGRGLTAADFDGDGIVDLAVGLRNQSTLGALGTRRSGIVSFLRGRGDTFVPDGIAPWLERAPVDIASGDFNGDGKPDIVAITKTQSLVQAMLNLSSPGPTVRGDRRRD